MAPPLSKHELAGRQEKARGSIIRCVRVPDLCPRGSPNLMTPLDLCKLLGPKTMRCKSKWVAATWLTAAGVPGGFLAYRKLEFVS